MKTNVGAAQAHARMTGAGVLVVEFRGPITSLAMLDELKRPIADRARGSALAVLADYTRAVLAVSDAEICRMMGGHDLHNLPDLPACVLAPTDTAPRLKRHAVAAVLHHRLVRLVETDRAGALHWAHRLACEAQRP
jgi:hypothetical protein